MLRIKNIKVKSFFSIMGVFIMAFSIMAILLKQSESKAVNSEELKEVNHIIINSDVTNIEILKSETKIHYKLSGKASFFIKPKLALKYDKGQATLTVKAIPKKWMYFIPGNVKRTTLQLFIPERLLSSIKVHTKNGNIHLEDIEVINHTPLVSNIGNIKVDSFKGSSIQVIAKNGAIIMGKVKGEVAINNHVGSLKEITFSEIIGKNTIKLSNGNAKILLPSSQDLTDIQLNIETKNGHITTNNTQLKNHIIINGAGQNIKSNNFKNRELNISVSVGNIEIN